MFTRIFEAFSLASVILTLIPNVIFSNDYDYFLAMLVLGIGSVLMCLTLYKHHIAPKWLAIWGIIGYTIFSFGFLMELFNKEWSMNLLGPAGLWEITFAIWLIVKGGQNEKITNR